MTNDDDDDHCANLKSIVDRGAVVSISRSWKMSLRFMNFKIHFQDHTASPPRGRKLDVQTRSVQTPRRWKPRVPKFDRTAKRGTASTPSASAPAHPNQPSLIPIASSLCSFIRIHFPHPLAPPLPLSIIAVVGFAYIGSRPRPTAISATSWDPGRPAT